MNSVTAWLLQFAVFAFLFTLPRPGDSEMTFAIFESSCHLLLLPIYINHSQGRSQGGQGPRPPIEMLF